MTLPPMVAPLLDLIYQRVGRDVHPYSLSYPFSSRCSHGAPLHFTPAPALRKLESAMMLGGSLDFSGHSLCPNGVAISVKVTAYPALRSPSLFDCFVHLFGQVLQEMYADNMVFHNHHLLPFRHSTPSPPLSSPDAPGRILRVAVCHPLCIRAHVDSQVIKGHTR